MLFQIDVKEIKKLFFFFLIIFYLFDLSDHFIMLKHTLLYSLNDFFNFEEIPTEYIFFSL